MTPIETDFAHNGFSYRQLERLGNWAVFEQERAGRTVAFELVRIQQRPAETIRGRSYPAREVYPSSAMWDAEAFTIAEREEALRRLHRMAKESVRNGNGNELQAMRG